MMKDQVIQKNRRIQGGVPVFSGTRTPIKNLFDYLEAGETLEQFLFDFPAVDRAKAVAALELARAALDADAHGSPFQEKRASTGDVNPAASTSRICS